MKYKTREQWLVAAVEKLRPIFFEHGFDVPNDLLVSCGFASTGLRSGHIGQCWPRSYCSTNLNQLFISPALDDPFEVLDTLVHELVHAVDDCQHKHGKEFKKIALKIGMLGPMRSAGAGPQLKLRLVSIAQSLGAYPHGKLKVTHRKIIRASRPRARCLQCGYQVPMLKKFLAFGPPLCPVHKTEMSPIGEWEQ